MTPSARRSRILVAVDGGTAERHILDALSSPQFDVRVPGEDIPAFAWKPWEVDVAICSPGVVSGPGYHIWRGSQCPRDLPPTILVGDGSFPEFIADNANLFVVKDVPPKETLVALVGHAAGLAIFTREVLRMEKELASTVEELERLTGRLHAAGTCDPDTDLFNRGHFVTRLRAEIAAGGPVSVIFIDIDHLQKYNDTHGYDEGSYLLRQFADVLCSRFSSTNLVARYGGDEFTVLLSGVERARAVQAADLLRRHIEEFPFLGRETQPFGCMTVSIGVVSFPQDASSSEELLAAAEDAVRQAKKQGRNYVFPSSADRSRV